MPPEYKKEGENKYTLCPKSQHLLRKVLFVLKMSQIEQDFRQLMSRKPEIGKCYQEGLINRRGLARYLIKQGLAPGNQLEAIIAMLRRFEFQPLPKEVRDIFKNIKVHLKDNIIILDFIKEKELVQKLQKIVSTVNYDRGDTLKVVVGSGSVKLFLDQENEKAVKDLITGFKLKHRLAHISEVSVLFPEEAINMKGIISTVTQELTLNDIVITEIITATPELIIYVREEYVLKAYEILKRLRK